MGNFHSSSGGIFIGVVENSAWPMVEAHGFYSNAIRDPITGITISWGKGSPYSLVQCSGQVCDKLLERIDTNVLARAANGRATRIDLAVDMYCDIDPRDFVAQRNSPRFSGSGYITSETGTTCYVGSRQAERMARVYRYNSPHPRSHLLRAETEYKGEAAKTLCEIMSLVTLTEVTLSAHLPFGWQHPIWDTSGAVVSKIPARAYDKHGAETLKWLNDVVVPSIKKAGEMGLIDLREWLGKNFKS